MRVDAFPSGNLTIVNLPVTIVEHNENSSTVWHEDFGFIDVPWYVTAIPSGQVRCEEFMEQLQAERAEIANA